MQTDPETALDVVRDLARGVDPVSREELPTDHPCQQPRIIRAMFAAAEALEQALTRHRRRSALPDNTGKPWDEEEDRRLVGAFEAKKPLTELARDHRRTLGAIRARLLKHGKLEA